jgi:hypothetical protein
VLFNDSPQKLTQPFWRHVEFSVQEGYVFLEMTSNFSSFESLQASRRFYVSQVPVAHAWNPSYSGGRDQENRGTTAAQSSSSPDPIWK